LHLKAFLLVEAYLIDLDLFFAIGLGIVIEGDFVFDCPKDSFIDLGDFLEVADSIFAENVDSLVLSDTSRYILNYFLLSRF
jgi:hypothetical protein